ncbi:Inositolphosphorylceramide synthase subunit Kei1-domain-containing protein [Cerioporus squamosus]|nr:Inositolphosphorylceramide synthase subunit Kei1-domain-containing protein [Cerioporus squamosus]
MKLTLRPEWRLRPLSSFLGFLDIKTGVTIALLFALLNKVAGVYGLVAVLTGAGGSLAQLSLYIYSVLGLVALVWGLKAILHVCGAMYRPSYATANSSCRRTQSNRSTCHLFFADHILSTAWLVFFAVVWWVYTPHDGVPGQLAAQKEVMESGAGHNMTDEERAAAAMTIWNAEKGIATSMIVMGWLAKIYFAVLLYSYAIHLRKGSYRSLPYSRSYNPNGAANGSAYATSGLPDGDDDDVEEFYRLPVRAPTTQPQPPANGNARGGHTPTSSHSSFTDFVSAPGRSRRSKPGKSNLSISISANGGAGAGADGAEVLFDEDMSDSAGAGGSRDGRPEDRLPLMGASKSASSSHSRRASRSRD